MAKQLGNAETITIRVKIGLGVDSKRNTKKINMYMVQAIIVTSVNLS